MYSSTFRFGLEGLGFRVEGLGFRAYGGSMAVSPKSGSPFGGPHGRELSLVFQDLCWGPPILGNYQIRIYRVIQGRSLSS